jgi:hypothetical protein
MQKGKLTRQNRLLLVLLAVRDTTCFQAMLEEDLGVTVV